MKKSKGFTMVELLAAVAIMGMLTVMAFPTMRALQGRNEKQKYEEYGKSMVSAAKLYTDSYADDLFPKGYKNEFAKIYSEDLLKKDLLKNIGFTDVSCINGESFIVVAKYGDDYEYCLHLVCKPKKNPAASTVLYQETNREGICKTYDTRKVRYIYNPSVNGINRPQVEYIDEIIKGDDAYRALSPSKFSNFDYANNHQKFQHWKDNVRNKIYNIGDIVDSESLKSELTLYSEHRQYFYTVKYNGNGGSGTVTSHKCDYDYDCTLRANGYTYKGHTFLNWKDGNDKTYSPSTKYRNLVSKDDDSITLGANWKTNKAYILYNVNNGSFASNYLREFTINNSLLHKNNNSKFFSISYGETIGTNGLIDYNNPSYVNLVRPGYAVPSKSEWTDGAGTFYNMSANNYTVNSFCNADNGDCEKTLYVNWVPKQIVANFNCNGGTGGEIAVYTYDQEGQDFDVSCIRPGYTQTGWNTNANGTGTSYDLNYDVTNNWINSAASPITLYAQWRANVLNITYFANGGTMKSAHNEAITLDDDEVFYNSVSPYHIVAYGSTVNLANYNYSGWLNLQNSGYTVPAGAEWNTEPDGSGTSYNQGVDYSTDNFCDLSEDDCDVELYVNWTQVPFTCGSEYNYQTSNKKCYKTLNGAIDNVPKGGTITVLKNVNDSSNPTLTKKKSIKLNLKDKTVNLTDHPLKVSSGTLTITGSSSGKLITKKNIIEVIYVTAGRVNIKNVTIHNKYDSSLVHHNIGLYMTGGKAVLYSGAIKAGDGSGSGHSLIVFNNGGTFIMKGGLLESNSTMSSSNGGHGGSGLRSDSGSSYVNAGTIHVIKGGVDRCLLCAHSKGKIYLRNESSFKYDGSVNNSCIFFYVYGSGTRICYENTVNLSFSTSGCSYIAKFSEQGSGSIVRKSKC